MEDLSADEFMILLDTAFGGRRCVRTWLGYGEPLFLGLGNEILPPVVIGETSKNIIEIGQDQPEPPYELQTHFAFWSIERHSLILGSNEDEREIAETAANSLVGLQVSKWRVVSESWELHVEFEDKRILKVIPWALDDLNPDQYNSDAWVLKAPDMSYTGVTCDGRITRATYERIRRLI